jgi:hypothetical protein
MLPAADLLLRIRALPAGECPHVAEALHDEQAL